MSKVGFWSVAWPAWIVFTLAVTAKPYLWHLEYFRHPGPQFLPAYLAAVAALVAFAFFYIRLRQSRPVWIAREPRAFALFFLAFFLLYAPLATVSTLWILFVCFSLGRMALARVAETPLEQLTLWPAAGLGILSALLFVLGLAGLYHRWLIVALLVLAAAAFRRNASAIRDLLRRAEQTYVSAAAEPLWGLCLVFVFVFSLSSAMVALSPEIAFDPVSFHFVLAREYAAHHRLTPLPYLPYSYFPQNVEVLYTLGFLLDGQTTAKVLTYSFFPLAAMAAALVGRRWFSPGGALVGAALFVTAPFVAWTGSVAKHDLALALYLLAALYGVLRWIESRRFGWLGAAAMFLGFAFGVMHVAVLGAVPLGLLVLWHLRGSRLSLRQGVAAAAIFVCCGLYWHARAYMLTGNPVYPEALLSAARSTTAAGHPELSRLDRAGIYLSFPWRIHFRGLHAFDSPSPNPAGFFLVAFFPLLFRRDSFSRGAKLAVFFAVAYLLYWAGILIYLRFATAAFAVLFVYLADRMCAFEKLRRRKSVLAMAAYCLVFSLSLALIMEVSVPRLKLFAGRASPQQFLRESLITYRSLEALNRVAQPGERAYAVGNCSTFYAAVEYHCYYDFESRYSLEKIVNDLRRGHYQYLLVSNGWAEPQHLRMIEHWFRPALLYEDESFRLYRLGTP